MKDRAILYSSLDGGDTSIPICSARRPKHGKPDGAGEPVDRKPPPGGRTKNRRLAARSLLPLRDAHGSVPQEHDLRRRGFLTAVSSQDCPSPAKWRRGDEYSVPSNAERSHAR